MRALGYLAAAVLGGAATYAATHYDQIVGPARRLPEVAKLELSYTDFVTVMFTAATLVLGGVALLVALVAIFSYQGMKDEARRTIRKAVDEQVQGIDARIEREVSAETEQKLSRAIERAGRDGTLDAALEKALIAIGLGGTKLTGELDKGFAPDDEDEDR